MKKNGEKGRNKGRQKDREWGVGSGSGERGAGGGSGERGAVRADEEGQQLMRGAV